MTELIAALTVFVVVLAVGAWLILK